MRLSKLVLVLAAFMSAAMPASAGGPYGSIRVAGWSGGGYTDDNNGQFTGCIVTASYKSGISVVIMVTQNLAWRLGFGNEAWQLNPGGQFPIVLTFDGRQPFNVTGRIIGRSLVSVDMPDNSALITQFRGARTMSAFAEGNLFQFSLNGTAQVLPALVRCVKTINDGGLAAATNFSAPQPKPAVAAAAPPPRVGSSLRPDAGGASSPELQIEALELASNFIMKASLKNAKVLSRAETPVALASNGAAWRADDALGFVRIIPAQDGIKGLDVASAIVAGDAKDCKGKFASARNSELVDSDVVFRGMSSCEDSERVAVSEYFILPRKRGGFVMFSVVAGAKLGEFKPTERETKNTDFRKAALVAVGP
ncbi:hypothetical protein [Bradyrhizobium sp. 2TAF24]|uniref:hypothetical protein n=1 Tax=Bradyrhizobium sp. 2TAF24 TaxID=3233011 RepID=UPI003F8ED2A4